MYRSVTLTTDVIKWATERISTVTLDLGVGTLYRPQIDLYQLQIDFRVGTFSRCVWNCIFVGTLQAHVPTKMQFQARPGN